MLDCIPNDCIWEINKNLSIYDKYHIYYSLCRKKELKIYYELIVYRIQLFYIYHKRLKNLKKNIFNFMNKLYRIPYYKTQNCLYYAPMVSGGICRICNKLENKHPITEKCMNLLFDKFKTSIY
tara:strand:- start:298 stop:666 length:369 start_codon:yes stop_codon:yes gene_type:complete